MLPAAPGPRAVGGYGTAEPMNAPSPGGNLLSVRYLTRHILLPAEAAAIIIAPLSRKSTIFFVLHAFFASFFFSLEKGRMNW